MPSDAFQTSSPSEGTSADSFASSIKAAGWHVQSVAEEEAQPVNSIDVDLDVWQLLARLKETTKEAQDQQKVDRIASRASSITSAHLCCPLKELTGTKMLWNASMPLLSPIFDSYSSSSSTSPTSTNGDQTPSSLSSYSPQLSWLDEEDTTSPASTQGSEKAKIYQPPKVEYLAENITSSQLSRDEAVFLLVKHFPKLCEGSVCNRNPGRKAPHSQNKRTYSHEERNARQSAVRVEYKGSVSHSLLKVSVILETRHIIWRKVDGLSQAQQIPAERTLDKTALDPWALQLEYRDIDVTDMANKRLRRVFQIKDSDKVGQCDGCSGFKLETCQQCKGSYPDTCSLCDGMNEVDRETCKQCSGKEGLACKGCDGKGITPCSRCEGQGRCLYIATLQVSMTRVDLSPVSLSSFTDSKDGRSVEDICTDKARKMVEDLLQPDEEHRSRPSRPYRITATINSSSSHLVKVEIPGPGRTLLMQPSNAIMSRASSFFQRKVSYLPAYFVLPSDPALGPIQLSAEEFQATLSEQEASLLPFSNGKQPEISGTLMQVECDNDNKLNSSELPRLLSSSASTFSSLDMPSSFLCPELVD